MDGPAVLGRVFPASGPPSGRDKGTKRGAAAGAAPPGGLGMDGCRPAAMPPVWGSSPLSATLAVPRENVHGQVLRSTHDAQRGTLLAASGWSAGRPHPGRGDGVGLVRVDICECGRGVGGLPSPCVPAATEAPPSDGASAACVLQASDTCCSFGKKTLPANYFYLRQLSSPGVSGWFRP